MMIRKKALKYFALVTAMALANQILFPIAAKALTAGPTQPEVQQFQHVGAGNLVDPFTGDFSYNIPLLNVGGYPVNLSYASGIQSDQEASWVGLGWNVNVGAVTRSMRGLPDEFRGDLAAGTDLVTTYTDMKPVVTHAVNLGPAFELLGLEKSQLDSEGSGSSTIPSLDLNLGVYHNSLSGIGISLGINPGFTSLIGTKVGSPLFEGKSSQASLQFSFDSQGGATLSADAAISKNKHKELAYNAGVSTGVNSRSGMRSLNLNAGSGRFLSQQIGFSFGHPTYVPRAQMPLLTTSHAVSFKFGLEFLGLSKSDVVLSGSKNVQEVAQKEVKTPAYGYRYASYANSNPNVLLDYNRERDGAWSKQVPALPLTNLTYDIYQVSGQGIGGAFRFQRGDVGVLHDDRVVHTSNSNSLGFDVAGGSTAAYGLNLSKTLNSSVIGPWLTDLNGAVAYQGPQSNSLYEAAPARMLGEQVVFESDYLDRLGGPRAVAPKLEGGVQPSAKATLVGKGLEQPLANSLRERRVQRNTSVRILNGDEAEQAGLHRNIPVYDLNGDGISVATTENRVSGTRLAHHPSEIHVQSTDGGSHVYGIPALNTSQRDISFSVGSDDYTGSLSAGIDFANGLVDYSPSIISNKKGLGTDEYYTETSLPPHAHSYLLSAYLSSDYEDIGQNGPSPDDLGSYVKFNYAKLTGSYKWRFPFEQNKARHDRGLRNDPTDDRAHISYGQKEIWYLKGIETRDYVAVFRMSDREDGRGVAGVNGGMDSGSSKLQKLDRIDLYARRDYLENGSLTTPIQSVHFEYDYSLSTDVPNSTASSGGKLTLKSVYFTHYNSERGSRNAYRFTYGGFNPAYSQGSNDRWGQYRESNPAWGQGDVTNSDFPYSEQDKGTADQWAGVWALTRIDLPSGGSMEVDYESDDYAYVQDRRAMTMTAIHGFSDKADGTGIGSQLYAGDVNKQYLYFDLAAPLPHNALGVKFLREQYFSSNEELLYFRALVRLNGDKISYQAAHDEYVNGYARIARKGSGLDVGLDPSSVSNGEASRAWVKLETENAKDIKSNFQVHPISLAAWQYTRQNQPQLVFEGSDLDQDIGKALKSLLASFGELKDFFLNINRKMRKRKFAKTVTPSKSWIRLTDPDMVKFGGGSRVKRLTVNDHWGDLSAAGHASGNYTQEFDYRKQELIQDLDGDGSGEERMVSSGVAAYEPLVGGDENPFRQPIGHKGGINYLVKNFLSPDTRLYQEGPIGESLFPSPTIGYSQVIVRNTGHLDQQGAPLTETHGGGFALHEFYTARDFPTHVEFTDMDHKRRNMQLGGQVLLQSNLRKSTAAQGFYVERNDMHGKPKANWAYAENALDADGRIVGWPISGAEYIYQRNQEDPRRLRNTVALLKDNLDLELGEIGMEVDFITDLRESRQEIQSSRLSPQFDANFSILGISSWVFLAIQIDIFQSAVATKVVDKKGVLEKVVAWDRQAHIPTENLVYDAGTGLPLLTRTWNEFGQPIHSFSYPLHWAYGEGMGAAAIHEGFQANGALFTSNTDNELVLNNLNGLPNPFVLGDEVTLERQGNILGPYWVNRVSGNSIWLVDFDGEIPPSSISGYAGWGYTVKVIHPGRQNQHTGSMASIQSLGSPVVSNGGSTGFDLGQMEENVLSAGAVEFKDTWKMFCTKTAFVETSFRDKWINRYGDGLPLVYSSYPNPAPNEFFIVETANPVSNSEQTIDYVLYDFNGNNISQFQALFTTTNGNNCNNTSLQNQSTVSQTQPDQLALYFDAYCAATGQTIACSLFVPSSNSSFLSFFTAKAENQEGCYSQGDYVNPFLQGLRGHWRPLRSYAYLTDRNATASQPNVREDGVFADFTPFWTYAAGAWSATGSSVDQWQFTAEGTEFHPRGLEVETKDALGNFSAATTGYDASLVTGMAKNAKYNELMFEGFEDYALRDAASDCDLYHWDMIQWKSGLVTEKAHTGLRSLKVEGLPAWRENRVDNECGNPGNFVNTSNYKYMLDCGDCMDLFEPNRLKANGTVQKYVLHAWASEDLTGRIQPRKLDQPQIEIRFPGTSVSHVIAPKGTVIDGWQRLEFEFEIPLGADDIQIFLQQKDPAGPAVYFDDLRVSPYDAGMVSYVYHVDNRRLMAELDANHFATFYEYDEDGSLIRVKKETERGVMTLQESRMNLAKQQP